MNIINWLDSLYARLPHFSLEIRNFIVKVLPFITLFIGILIAFAGIMDIIGTPFLSIFSSSKGTGVFQQLMIVSVIGIIQGILMIAAFRPLRKKVKSGWKLIFWSQMLWIISALIILSPSFILGFLFFYPLFQVRSHYR